jgi:hypothetical protein
MDTATVLGMVIAAGGGLTTAVTALWKRVTADIDECKKDRLVLSERIESMQTELVNLSRQVGELSAK